MIASNLLLVNLMNVTHLPIGVQDIIEGLIIILILAKLRTGSKFRFSRGES